MKITSSIMNNFWRNLLVVGPLIFVAGCGTIKTYESKAAPLDSVDQYLKERNYGSYVETEIAFGNNDKTPAFQHAGNGRSVSTGLNRVNKDTKYRYKHAGQELYWSDRPACYHGIINPVENVDEQERRKLQMQAKMCGQPHLEYINICPYKGGYVLNLYLLAGVGTFLIPQDSVHATVEVDKEKKLFNITFSADEVELTQAMVQVLERPGHPKEVMGRYAQLSPVKYIMKGKIQARYKDEKKVHGIYKMYGWQGEDD